MNQNFSDAALILAGHGSTVNSDSAAPTRQQAAELRRRGLFGQVREAFWKQEPHLADVLASVTLPRVFIVPLFISEGYFTEEAIPRELGLRTGAGEPWTRIRQVGGRTIYYCSPVGTHSSMTRVILARAQEVIDKHPFPRAPQPAAVALFIAGHGTNRNENSRRAIEQQVDLIRARNLYASVHAVFLEERPGVEECYALAAVRNLVMVPFFISDGLHSYEDIPVRLGEAARVVRERLARGQPTWRNPTERQGKLLWYGRSVGTEPHLADVIVERAREASAASAAAPGVWV